MYHSPIFWVWISSLHTKTSGLLHLIDLLVKLDVLCNLFCLHYSHFHHPLPIAFSVMLLNHGFPSWTLWIICTATHLPSTSCGSFFHAWESFQVFVTELCEVLVHFKTNCEDVDLLDRAHMYHSLLVSLSNKKVCIYTHTHTNTLLPFFTSYCPMYLCIRPIDTVIFIFMYGLYNGTLSIATLQHSLVSIGKASDHCQFICLTISLLGTCMD